MPLPKIEVPTYEMELISNKTKIKFRPFLIKEQKLFLMTNESDDPAEMINTIRQVAKNCVLTNIDIDSLPTFDLEYVFLNLRARSISEVVNLKYQCNNTVKDNETNEEKKCGTINDINVNLLEIKPELNENINKKIELSPSVGIILKYPTFEISKKIVNKNENEMIIELIQECIDYIYDGDTVFHNKDIDRKELIDFIDNLQQKDLEKMQQFFMSIPKLSKKIDYTCTKCGYHEVTEIEGLQNFFG